MAGCGSSNPGNTGGNGGSGGNGGNGSGGNTGSGGNGGNGGTPVPPADLAVPPDYDKFDGTWVYGTGATSTNDCLGMQPPTDISMQTFTVTHKSGETVSLSAAAGSNCNFDFTVAGTQASIVMGQTCMVTGMGITITLTSKTGTMSTSDGINASLSTTASVNGACTATISAPHAKKM